MRKKWVYFLIISEYCYSKVFSVTFKEKKENRKVANLMVILYEVCFPN